MWQMTRDTMWGVNNLSKFLLPSSYGLELTVSWIFWNKGSVNELMNQSITSLFVEQPQKHFFSQLFVKIHVMIGISFGFDDF